MLSFLMRAGRLVGFWLITVVVVLAASAVLTFIRPRLVADTIFAAAFNGDIDPISRPDFAYALAGLIAATAVGLAAAFFLVHVAPVLTTLWRARRGIALAQGQARSRAEARREFTSNFESLSQRFERNWLIGHAWIEFEETLFDTDSTDAIGNTVRPQAFFNIALARERLGGLKMLNAVPGYFVGIGLLLTFIGLVFALHKAGAAAAAGDASQMAQEMGGLLQIATFKFSTSIAGLGASIVLSIFFRLYSIWIEAAFERFNASLERALRYQAPQTIALEMKEALQDQLVQLKNITQGDFFARMGAEMAPRLNAAITEAMAPVAEQIGSAVGSLTATSQDGVQDLLSKFTDSLQNGAGTEMRELAATLRQLQMSIAEMQGGLRGSGDDFSAKLSEAADNLNRMVERAGQSFEASSGQGRDALVAVVEALRQTMEKANAEMDQALGSAASGASARLEAAMGEVMQRLDGQIGQLGIGIDALQKSMGDQGEVARKQIADSVLQSAEMQKSVLADLQGAAVDISETLRSAAEKAVATVSDRFEVLSSSMRAIETALAGQKIALEGTTGEARRTAEALGEGAQSIRAATDPLIKVGNTFSGATDRMATGVDATLAALRTAQAEIAALAATLDAANQRAGAFWTGFQTKFDDVDTALGRAVSTLSTSTANQQDRLNSHVVAVDKGLSEAIGKLSGFLAQMTESAESIADSLSDGAGSKR